MRNYDRTFKQLSVILPILTNKGLLFHSIFLIYDKNIKMYAATVTLSLDAGNKIGFTLSSIRKTSHIVKMYPYQNRRFTSRRDISLARIPHLLFATIPIYTYIVCTTSIVYTNIINRICICFS